jgi:hypothetical protein
MLFWAKRRCPVEARSERVVSIEASEQARVPTDLGPLCERAGAPGGARASMPPDASEKGVDDEVSRLGRFEAVKVVSRAVDQSVEGRASPAGWQVRPE